MTRKFIPEDALPDWVLTDARARLLVAAHFSSEDAQAASRGAAQMPWVLMARYGIPLDQQVAAIHFVGYGYGLVQLGDWPIDVEHLRSAPPAREARLQMIRECCCTHADVFEGVRKQKDIFVGLIDNEIDTDLWWAALPLLELGYGIVPFQALP